LISPTPSFAGPWQNDVTYCGFLASPLTGSAIGLSVYLDRMRFGLSTMARLKSTLRR